MPLITDSYFPAIEQSVIIVGAGLAGMQVAWDLHRLGVEQIWVCEAGNNFGLQHVNISHSADDVNQIWQYPVKDPSFFKNWDTTTPPHFGSHSGGRRRIGGRSLYWHGVILPLEDWALNPAWPTAVVEDLTKSWSGGKALYNLQIDELNSWINEIGGHDFPVDHLHLNKKLFNHLDVQSATPTPQAIRWHRCEDAGYRWEAYSPLSHWLGELQNENSSLPTITYSTEVISILQDKGRVRGVKVFSREQNRIIEVNSKVVVLAVGTMQIAKLVLASVLTNDNRSNNTLTGICDHIVQGAVMVIPRHLLDMTDGEFNTPFFSMIQGTEDTRSNTFLNLSRLSDDLCLLDVWSMGEQLPSLENMIFYDNHNDRLKVTVRLSPYDQQVIDRQKLAIRGIFDKISVSLNTLLPDLKFPDFYLGSFTFSDALKAVPDLLPMTPLAYTCHLGTGDHEGGILPLGQLLTNEGELPQLSGLFAVGPATFPRSGAANPSLTTLSLAKRLAGHIVTL